MILLLLTFNLFAQEIAIQSKNTLDIEYQRHLMKNPNQLSFIQYQLLKENGLKIQLFENLKTAQFHFINGNLEEARVQFNKITEMQHKAQWPLEQQKAIHFAFLRLAQLSPKALKQTEIMQESLWFNNKIEADETLFPPPFVKRYKALKKRTLEHIWPLPQQASLFDSVYINGEKHKIDSSFVKTTAGVKHISFLSNKYKRIDLNVSPEELEKLKLVAQPLSTGSCSHPTFHTSHPSISQKKLLFIGQGCVGRSLSSLNSPLLAATAEPQSSIKKTDTAFYKNRWFLIGASVLAAGFAISHLQEQNKSSSLSPSSQEPPPIQTFSNQ